MQFCHSTAESAGIVLVAFAFLVGCRGAPQETTLQVEPEARQVLVEAIEAQHALYEAEGEELRAQYEKMVEEYPLMGKYVALQEVALALYAMAFVMPEDEIDCMEYRMLSSPGNTIWFSLCRDDLFVPDYGCISACLDCLKTGQAMSCFQQCGCLKRMDTDNP